MSLIDFDDLFRSADHMVEPVPVVAAGGADPTVLEAMSLAERRGWIRPVVTGNRNEIEQLAVSLGIDLTSFRVISSDDPAASAVEEIRRGNARMLMKGQIATPSLMKAVLSRDMGLRTNRVICQIVLMEILRDRRSFLLADTGITIQPSLEQKEDILKSLIDVALLLRRDVEQPPRIAIMSATEKVVDSMPDTLDAAEISMKAATHQYSSAVVHGPLSFDLAYANDAGEKKKIEGGVVGAADAMLFPDLLSANLTVKGIMYTADCRFGGVLWGATCPVVFMSRADTTPTRLNSLALSLCLLS